MAGGRGEREEGRHPKDAPRAPFLEKSVASLCAEVLGEVLKLTKSNRLVGLNRPCSKTLVHRHRICWVRKVESSDALLAHVALSVQRARAATSTQ